MSDNLNNFVALNSSQSTPSVLCAHNCVMRVLNKMSMMTTLSLCVSCEFSQAVFVWVLGRAPHFFLNRALLRLNPALDAAVAACCYRWRSVVCPSVGRSVCHVTICGGGLSEEEAFWIRHCVPDPQNPSQIYPYGPIPLLTP